MTDIGIRSQFPSHFYQMNLLSFHTKMDSTFASSQTSTQNNNLISNLFLFKIIVIYDDNVISIQSFDWWNQRLRSYSNDQCIRIFFFYVLWGDFCGSADFHTRILCEKRISLRQLIHFLFKRNSLFTFQNTTKFLFFFT